MRTLLLLALAGCNFYSTGAQIDAGSGSQAPDGDPSPIDTPAADGDRDDDGIANDDDNCPDRANPEQFNEDGDARGDDCDPCPQLGAAADDADGDGDGVGDGCDPQPGTPGDRLAYWNGFHVDSATLPSTLAMVHGSAARWSVAGGYLLFTPNNEDWGIPVVDVAARSHTTDATFEITMARPAGTAQAAGVAVDVAGNDDDATECQARTDNNQRELWYWNDPVIGPGSWTALDVAPSPTPNGTYRIVLRRTLGDLTCTTIHGGTGVALADPRDSSQQTRAGLFARNVDVRYLYLAIYTSP